jgi:hypothetical protein
VASVDTGGLSSEQKNKQTNKQTNKQEQREQLERRSPHQEAWSRNPNKKS